MVRSLRMCVLALGGLLLTACGDDGDGENDAANCGATCPDGDDQGAKPGTNLLGANATTYSEANEASNADSPEATSYVLEAAEGLAIEGSVESGTPTADSFIFNSGSLGAAGKPGFPGVDIQVLAEHGAMLSTVSLTLDTVQEFGYSVLRGSGGFNNAALIQGQDYVLRVTPSEDLAGKAYTILVRGHTPE